MNPQSTPCRSWREGADYPSPVEKVLALEHYDGPMEGVLQCAGGDVYRFDMLAWDEETQDVRIFGLSPLSRLAWDHLLALCAGHDSPRWPVWAFRWQEQLRQAIEEVLRQAGPMQWVVATTDLLGEIGRVKALRPEERMQVTNWGAFLGLAPEWPVRAPHEKG